MSDILESTAPAVYLEYVVPWTCEALHEMTDYWFAQGLPWDRETWQAIAAHKKECAKCQAAIKQKKQGADNEHTTD